MVLSPSNCMLFCLYHRKGYTLLNYSSYHMNMKSLKNFFLFIMLDIVQSFPLLFYCIVSPIYISPICNVEIRFIIMRK